MPNLEEILSTKEQLVTQLLEQLHADDFALVRAGAELLVYHFRDDRILPHLLDLIQEPRMEDRTAHLVFLCSQCGAEALMPHWRAFIDWLLYGNYHTSLNAAYLLRKLADFDETTEELKAIVEQLKEAKEQVATPEQWQNVLGVIQHLEGQISLQQEIGWGAIATQDEEVALYLSFRSQGNGGYIEQLNTTIPMGFHRSWKMGEAFFNLDQVPKRTYTFNNCSYRVTVAYEQVEEGLLDLYQVLEEHLPFLVALQEQYGFNVGLSIVHQDRAELLSFVIPEPMLAFVSDLGGYIELD